MRNINPESVSNLVAELFVRANRELPPDITAALEAARSRETGETARYALSVCAENLKAADPLPICQDTGLAAVFIEWGGRCALEYGDLQSAVDKGVALGCERGYLRPSIVRDPLRRVNTGDGAPAVLHVKITDGEDVKVTVAPKGFGSENMTRLKMFTPAAGEEDILDFIAESVKIAGGNPCPPVVLGIGIGGTADTAVLDAKSALLLPVSESSPDPFWAAFERKAFERVNALGIGAQGLGGDVTALGARVVTRPTHIAGLPAAVVLGCWVTRRAEGAL